MFSTIKYRPNDFGSFFGSLKSKGVDVQVSTTFYVIVVHEHSYDGNNCFERNESGSGADAAEMKEGRRAKERNH